MMNILEIYEKYRVMPTVVEHQLRVGAVASMICDSFVGELDKDMIVTIALLHDMGNIVKFDFDNNLFKNRYSKEELNYWKSIQKDVREKYGNTENDATANILKEIGLNENIVVCVNAIEFFNSCIIAEQDNFIVKIVEYADIRVSPFEITSIHKRLKEAARRYGFVRDEKDTEQIKCLEEIEKEIFSHCSIEPSDITNESAFEIIEKLKSFKVSY